MNYFSKCIMNILSIRREVVDIEGIETGEVVEIERGVEVEVETRTRKIGEVVGIEVETIGEGIERIGGGIEGIETGRVTGRKGITGGIRGKTKRNKRLGIRK